MQKSDTAEQSKKTQPAQGRTEKQPDDKAKEAKEEAEAEDESVEIEKQGSEIRVTKEGGEQIYIGFDKGAKTRDGKGRIIEADASRYPDRTLTRGGWAGGDQGLAAFIEVHMLHFLHHHERAFSEHSLLQLNISPATECICWLECLECTAA